jgi:hypothetical protein
LCKVFGKISQIFDFPKLGGGKLKKNPCTQQYGWHSIALIITLVNDSKTNKMNAQQLCKVFGKISQIFEFPKLGGGKIKKTHAHNNMGGIQSLLLLP